MQVAIVRAMRSTVDSPRNSRRRVALQNLVDSSGGLTTVAAELGTPKSHLSAILNGRRGIGDALAARVEKHYGLPAGALDAEGSEAVPPVITELTGLLIRLTDAGKMTMAEVEAFVTMLKAREMTTHTQVPADANDEAMRLIQAAHKSPDDIKREAKIGNDVDGSQKRRHRTSSR